MGNSLVSWTSFCVLLKRLYIFCNVSIYSLTYHIIWIQPLFEFYYHIITVLHTSAIVVLDINNQQKRRMAFHHSPLPNSNIFSIFIYRLKDNGHVCETQCPVVPIILYTTKEEKANELYRPMVEFVIECIFYLYVQHSQHSRYFSIFK